MTVESKNNSSLCVLLPLAFGIGALLFFYYSSRESISTAIESDLAYKSNELLKENQIGNATVTMDGRDALLTGTASSQERSNEIEDIISTMPGIRVVENQLEVANNAAIIEESETEVIKQIDPPTLETLPEADTDPAPVSDRNDEQMVEELLETLDLSGIKFLFGKDEITNNGKLVLDEVTRILTEHPEFDVAINGYTDNIGDDLLNLQLSQQRAESVLNYLTNNGIQPSRLSATGFGKSSPIADNSTAEGRALNRRIEFEVSKRL